MGILSLLFKNQKSNRRIARRQAGASRRPSASRTALHRELVSVALRDTMIRHGIPSAWMSADMHSAFNTKGEPQCHVRLLLKHWDARLMEHAVAFEKSFAGRISLLDSNQHAWLRSISWQFSLPADHPLPQMPPANSWRGASTVAQQPAPTAAPAVVKHSQLESLRALLAHGDSMHESPDAADFQNTMPFDEADDDSFAGASAR